MIKVQLFSPIYISNAFPKNDMLLRDDLAPAEPRPDARQILVGCFPLAHTSTQLPLAAPSCSCTDPAGCRSPRIFFCRDSGSILDLSSLLVPWPYHHCHVQFVWTGGIVMPQQQRNTVLTTWCSASFLKLYCRRYILPGLPCTLNPHSPPKTRPLVCPILMLAFETNQKYLLSSGPVLIGTSGTSSGREPAHVRAARTWRRGPH